MTAETLRAVLNSQILEVEERLNSFRTQAVQLLEEELVRTRGEGGRMRVDTGFLRASLRASTSHMPQVNPAFNRDPSGMYSFESTGAALTTSYDQDLRLGFTASYAGAREVHDMFVEGAVQEWPSICAEAERRVLGG